MPSVLCHERYSPSRNIRRKITMARSASVNSLPRLGDFTTDRRVLMLVAMAVLVGGGGAVSAWVLLHAIALTTNLVWLHRFSAQNLSLSAIKPDVWMVAIPAIGGLVIGLMARFGSEKIRGHGIPEAIEAILIGGSRMQPKVAILKPLSSAISIGTGGPFGAEGPIIMTGGAIGSLFAQCFSLSAAERKALLVAGAAVLFGITTADGLIERAQQIERLIIERLLRLQAADDRIGDVRGRGAMIAVEFVKPDTAEPDAALTNALAAAAHAAGVIVLTAGTFGNVVRFLPPLTISDELLTEGLDVLTGLLAGL